MKRSLLFMSYARQEFFRKEYQRLKPDWVSILPLYIRTLAKYVSGDAKILDIGCGHADFLAPVFNKAKEVFGVDIDAEALEKNKTIKNKFVGSAEKLPFPNNSFDLICCAWVMEHLNNPDAVLKEIYRVLKPEGRFIFLTPNSQNYNIWLIRLIPNFLHDFLTKRLYGRQEKDTMSVYYKINNLKTIRQKFSIAGFAEEELILNADPSYISFNKLLFRVAVFLEKIIVKYFPDRKVYLIGVFQKSKKSI